jgi:hypothetical protein
MVTNYLTQGDKYMGGIVNFDTQTGQRLNRLQQTPINPEIIGNTPQINIPNLPAVNYNSTITGVNASLGAPTGGLIPLPPTVTPTPTGTETTPAPTKTMSDTVKEMLGLQAPSVDVAGEYAKAEEAAGIQAKQQQVSSLTNQINAITAQSQAEQLQLDTPVTGAGNTDVRASLLDKQKAEISRNAAIKILPLAAQLSAATGDLNTAQTHLDKYFGMVVDQANARTQQYNDVVEKAYTLFTNAEQNRLNEIKEERRNNSTQMTDAVNQNQLYAKSALDNNDNSTFSALTALSAPDTSSPTFQQDLQDYNSKVANIMLTAKPNTLRIAQIASANRANQESGSGGSGISSTTQAIINNPSLFDDLTPTERGKVITQLQSNGFDTSNLGTKGLTDTAIKEVAQTQKALDDLDVLRSKIEGNEQFVGPIKGLQKYNPWSKARQVQADVDRVRQTVGKALEGGVLRKEDEEKYKKILATLTDTPETALYKIDALKDTIARDIENYKLLQQGAGRSLNVGTSLQKTGSVIKKEDLRTKYNY